MFLVGEGLRAPWLKIRITGRGGSPRLVRQEPRPQQGRGSWSPDRRDQ